MERHGEVNVEESPQEMAASRKSMLDGMLKDAYLRKKMKQTRFKQNNQRNPSWFKDNVLP
jgi:hypothetical protein